MAPPDKTTLGYMDLTIEQLETKHVQYVLWQTRPALSRASNEPIEKFAQYLQLRYRPIHVFTDGDTIWERK